MEDELYLVGSVDEKDAKGVFHSTPRKRQVYCQTGPITRQEFFQAGRNGLNPETQFSVFAGDYAGERECEYGGQRYAIYRTYLPPGSDYIELYVERKGGTNAKDTH